MDKSGVHQGEVIDAEGHEEQTPQRRKLRYVPVKIEEKMPTIPDSARADPEVQMIERQTVRALVKIDAGTVTTAYAIKQEARVHKHMLSVDKEMMEHSEGALASTEPGSFVEAGLANLIEETVSQTLHRHGERYNALVDNNSRIIGSIGEKEEKRSIIDQLKQKLLPW